MSMQFFSFCLLFPTNFSFVVSFYLYTLQACQKQMAGAAQRAKKKAMKKDPSLTDNDVVDVAESYDGTWQKRGHTSNHGIGAVISVQTGEVLDREVLSKVCKECDFRKGWDKKEDKYKKWWARHEGSCLRNHKGSSGKMEVDAAVVMWKRSVSKYKIRYRYMLCDLLHLGQPIRLGMRRM